jgi:hypothetical protein
MHPREQRDALAGALNELGIVNELVAFRDPAAPDVLTLCDGHLRAEGWQDAEWRVAETDFTPDEARKYMLTADPLAAMAEADTQALAGLLAQVETDDEALRAMLEALADGAGVLSDGVTEGREYDEAVEAEVKKATCPECGHVFPV